MNVSHSGAAFMAFLSYSQKGYVAYGDITMYESQLFRAYGRSHSCRPPGYRPTYSYGLAHPISKNSLMRGMAHSWLPSGTFIVKEGGNR